MIKSKQDAYKVLDEYVKLNEEDETKALDYLASMDDEDYVKLISLPEADKIQTAKTFLHCHTDLGSPKDSVLTINRYVQAAVRMHTSSLSVTDHGTMYAVQPLYQACKNAGIKLIIGVEFYVCDDADDKSVKNHQRLHLIAYAIDRTGYDAISHMVSESNRHIVTTRGGLSFPCISKAILKSTIGPGTEAHGHVFLTSACIGGVVAGLVYRNETIKTNIAELEDKAGRLSQIADSLAEEEASVGEMKKSIEALTQSASRTFAKAKSLAKGDSEQLAKISEEEKKTNEAKEKIKNLRTQIRSSSKILTRLQNDADKILKTSFTF